MAVFILLADDLAILPPAAERNDLGVLNFALTDKELPAWFPLRLNTHSWRFLLPELNRRYPNQEMALRGVMAEAPDTVITPEGARTEAMLDLHFVVLNGTEETTAIIFRIDFTSSADFFIDTPAATAGPVIRIGAHIAYGSCNITTQASTIGPVDAWLLNDTLAALLKGVVVPALNKLAERGVQIPLAVKQFELVHPALTYAQDYLVVETDFTFIA
ncbi:putative LBP / BPI / CETP family; C-terminal domain [Paratrimastix pyriformis]|uniref:LBP / BPI / CETP family n=1 Tax=Paratrimastix pyriformis TaxID=342808 RepID=A0ABQ8U412_9EUKA|nr:putative LBP / BPI / CETP family; C-terminal domain [Paratrimastix pyriformis]